MLFHDFVAGRAYYLGDYFARGIFELSMRSLYTVAFLELGDGFGGRSLRSHDGRDEGDVSQPRVRCRRRTSASSPPKPAPKPGAVVITDAKEPPMTPERIARVAPFIRRTFASPAACEAPARPGSACRFAVRRAPR